MKGLHTAGKMNMKKIKSFLPYIISLLTAVLMTLAAELTGEKEIIFPEITAIAVGALAAPKQTWNTSRLRLLLTITASAVLGVGIVRFVPLPLVFQVPLGIAAAFICIALSRTEFVPAVSACVLPILLQTKSVIYIISVVIMTSVILLSQFMLEKAGIREKNEYTPCRISAELIKLRLKQLAVMWIICILPAVTHEIFFIAPPLLVGFAEMTKPASKLKKRAKEVVLLIVIAAFSGAASRLLIAEAAGLPLTLAVTVSCGVILFAIHKMKLYFPPCGAIATLPMIIPSDSIIKFPFEAAAGFIVMTAAAFLLFRDKNTEAQPKSSGE